MRLHLLYLIHYIQSLNHFTKHGILAVQERCTAHGGVGFGLLLGERGLSHLGTSGLRFGYQLVLQVHETSLIAVLAQVHHLGAVFCHQAVEHLLFLLHGHLLLQLFQFLWLIHLAPHDIELASAACLFGVHLVALAGCTEHSTLVKELWIDYFSGNVVARTACTKRLAGRCTLALGITSLYHEIADNAVEERTIIVALGGQMQEVVAMKRCLVVEANHYVAL